MTQLSNVIAHIRLNYHMSLHI